MFSAATAYHQTFSRTKLRRPPRVTTLNRLQEQKAFDEARDRARAQPPSPRPGGGRGRHLPTAATTPSKEARRPRPRPRRPLSRRPWPARTGSEADWALLSEARTRRPGKTGSPVAPRRPLPAPPRPEQPSAAPAGVVLDRLLRGLGSFPRSFLRVVPRGDRHRRRRWR